MFFWKFADPPTEGLQSDHGVSPLDADRGSDLISPETRFFSV